MRFISYSVYLKVSEITFFSDLLSVVTRASVLDAFMPLQSLSGRLIIAQASCLVRKRFLLSTMRDILRRLSIKLIIYIRVTSTTSPECLLS